MTSGQLTFGGSAPRRTVGAHERRMQRTLTAWRRRGHLTGDEHAAARDVLTAAFRAVDAAEHAERAGDATPYALAMVNRTAHELLRAWSPPAVDGTDPLDEHLPPE